MGVEVHGTREKGRSGSRFYPERRCAFVEFKRPGEEPTLQQRNRHRQMKAKGANVTWVDNFEDFKNYLIAFE